MKHLIPLYFLLPLFWTPLALGVKGFDVVDRFLDCDSFQVIKSDPDALMQDRKPQVSVPLLTAPQSLALGFLYGQATKESPFWRALPESYLVMDPYNQWYVATFLAPQDMWSTLALHQLLELMDLPHLPAWPAFFQRGRNGVPTKAEARKLFPEAARVGEFPEGKETHWITAMVRPKVWDFHVDQSTNIEVEGVIQRFLEEVLLYAIFAERFEYAENLKQRLILSIHGAFSISHTVDLKKHTFKDVMRVRSINDKSLTPVMLRLKDFDPAHQTLFLTRVNQFLTRFESLQKGPFFERFFLDVIREKPEVAYSGQSSAIITRIRQNFAAITKRLRGEVEDYIESRIKGPYAKQARPSPVTPLLPVSAEIPKPRIVIPEKLNCTSVETLLSNASQFRGPRDYLLALAFMQEAERTQCLEIVRSIWAREHPNTDWGPLGIEGADVLHRFMGHAFYGDSRHQIILSDVSASAVERMAKKDPSLLQPQFHLNEAISEGALVVYSPNDREGLVLKSSLERMKLRLPVNALEITLRQGENLSADQFVAIASEAKRLGMEAVAIVECGVITQEQKRSFETQTKLRLFHLDHHANNSQDNRNPLSAVEQVWKIWGYAPGAWEWMEAAFDRSGATGFQDLGFSREQVMAWVAHQPNGAKLNRLADQLLSRSLAPEQDGEVTLFEVDPFEGTRREGFYPFEMLQYPDPSNVLLAGQNRVWFLGDADLVTALRTGMSTTASAEYQYCGGESSAGFWGCTVNQRGKNSDERRNTVTYQVKQILGAAIEQHGKTPCWHSLVLQSH